MTDVVRTGGADRAFYEQEHMWTGAPTPRERRRLADTIARIPLEGSFADIGAGDGRLLDALRAAGRAPALAVAVERSWAALTMASGDRVAGDAVAVPLRDRAVDTVSICEVVEHLPLDVYAATLAELQRVARRHIVVTVPNAEDLTRAMAECPSCRCRFHRHRHLRSFDERVLAGLLPDFELVELAEIGEPELAVPRSVVALGRRLGVVPPAGGLPMCPQCGYGESPPSASSAAVVSGGGRMSIRARARRAVTEVAAKGPDRLRRPPWLLAVYRRRPEGR